MRLEGKTAIVTGGASGFGEGIARRFAREGAKVIIADLNEDLGRKIAGSIAEEGGDCVFCACDVAGNRSMGRLAAFCAAQSGRLHIVVNNAGLAQINQPMLDVDEAAFDRIFAVNVKSIYLAAVHFVPLLRQGGGGAIINMASTAALSPRPGLTWYNGAKGAVVTLTKSMAVELAGDNIRVNALCPVAGDTPMLAAFMGGERSNEMHDKFVSTIPLGRLSTPRDLANAALFLASDEAEFLTGVALEVDGGRCI